MPQPKPLTTKRCTSLLNRIICTIIHLQRTENSIILTIEEMHSYRRSLVLTQAEFSGDLFPYIYITNYTLTQAQENSVLQLQAVYGTDPNEHCLRIEFAQAYLKDEIFSAMEVPEFQNPWHYLAAIARELEVKDENKVALTPKESALLPLCRALVMLVAYGNWRVDIDFEVLAPLFDEFTWPDRDKIQRRLTGIAKVRSTDTARRWLSCLIIELIDQKFEPVWREILKPAFPRVRLNRMPSASESASKSPTASMRKAFRANIPNSIAQILREKCYTFAVQRNMTEKQNYTAHYFSAGVQQTPPPIPALGCSAVLFVRRQKASLYGFPPINQTSITSCRKSPALLPRRLPAKNCHAKKKPI